MELSPATESHFVWEKGHSLGQSETAGLKGREKLPRGKATTQTKEAHLHSTREATAWGRQEKHAIAHLNSGHRCARDSPANTPTYDFPATPQANSVKASTAASALTQAATAHRQPSPPREPLPRAQPSSQPHPGRANSPQTWLQPPQPAKTRPHRSPDASADSAPGFSQALTLDHRLRRDGPLPPAHMAAAGLHPLLPQPPSTAAPHHSRPAATDDLCQQQPTAPHTLPIGPL